MAAFPVRLNGRLFRCGTGLPGYGQPRAGDADDVDA
jgi:hypothetical protein